MMIAPRGLIEFGNNDYSITVSSRGAAPSHWESPSRTSSKQEFFQFAKKAVRLNLDISRSFSVGKDFSGAIEKLPYEAVEREPAMFEVDSRSLAKVAAERESRLVAMIDTHNQALLAEAEYERGKFINLGHTRTVKDDASNRLDTSSVENYLESIEPFRKYFREEVIGWYGEPDAPLNARSVETHVGDGWTSHAVILDVFPEVIAYGQILVPDGIAPNEKRPVIVCQHGLEGRPEHTFLDDHRAYHDFAAKLAKSGFIVLAPQNPYIGGDSFRSIQRKSYPLGKTLFSIIAAQHRQWLRWLQSLPNVDPDRIAFYGLSYGGKSAMRLPALLPEYCLSICSADFNDWVWKNASSRSTYSYVGTPEYEIFEFGLGKTFNYAEMAALIAPRPFMVERGHFDGVAPDDRVSKEFAKVRHLYEARLKLEGKCEIEWFSGPHTNHGKGTFRFLQEHLNWPAR